MGYGYEAIRFGRQRMMLAGGAEELCVTQAGVFDTLYATSTRNNAPTTTPAPFDKDRDGLVIGEGACTLVLEEFEYAKARGAKIYAELVGYASNSDGDHLTHPNTHTMQVAMENALADAGIPASAIGYVSAHATAVRLKTRSAGAAFVHTRGFPPGPNARDASRVVRLRCRSSPATASTATPAATLAAMISRRSTMAYNEVRRR